MEEWKEYKLGDIAIITMGQSPNSTFYNSESVGTPFLQGNRTFGIKYPTFDTYTTSLTKCADENDVIMSVRAPVGDVNITPVKICLGRGVCGLHATNGNQEFLYYLMRYHSKDLINKETGTVFGSINRNDIANLSVKVPSVEVQKQISSMLASLDDKIECNKRINDNLEQQAQALFKSWFVDFEPFKNGEFVESEIGMIPKGWRVVSLNDACIKITDGSHYSPKDNPLGTIPMLSVKDMLHNGFDYSSCKMIDEDEYEKMRANDCVPLKNDILVAKDGSYLKEIFICSESAKQAILSSIAMFRCNKNVIFPEILLQLLRLPKVRKDVGDNYVSGSALPRIVLKDFKKFRFVIAPIDIQNEIAGTLQSINMQIYKNEQESRRLAQLRDTLLPKLMSGELKVNEID